MIEDGEEMVMNVAEHEAVGSSFSTPVKSYRILEGMGVTFHCKMEGTPLPKVMDVNYIEKQYFLQQHNVYK